MKDFARIAFVGAGNHSTTSLYPCITQIPEFMLAAVCDIDAEKAGYTAHKFGAPESFSDLTVMLDMLDLDGVCVCGMPDMHFEVAQEVLKRGIPVFVEKPPANCVADAEKLVSIAQENDTWGMVGFMKRFAPANVVTRNYMKTAGFGNLSSINLIHGAGPYNDVRRMLYFNGIHMIDLARFFAGEIAQVQAVSYDKLPDAKAVLVNFVFENGSVGHLNINSGGTWQDCFEQVYISGEASQILIDASRAVEVMSPKGRFAEAEGLELYGWSNKYYVSGNMAGWTSSGHYTRGYWGELQHFTQAVIGQVSPGPDLADGVIALKLIDSILLSAQTGECVTVS